MKEQNKHYLKVGITLCAICAVAAGLISLTNMITHKTIENNVIAKKEKAMKNIFSNALIFSDENKLENLNYCSSYYVAYSDENMTVEIGDIYYASGKNAYGSVILMVGIDQNGKHTNNIEVIENTESYASTLEDEYLNKIKDGYDISDVKCGATYGAKLVRDMILEAETNYIERHQG